MNSILIKRIILVIFVVLIPTSCSYSDSSKNFKYTLYIGLDDKITETQVIDDNEAADIVRDICLSHISGATIANATGFYTYDDGQPVSEKTIILIIMNSDDKTVRKICDEIRIKLNQESILIEKQQVSFEFYEGASAK